MTIPSWYQIAIGELGTKEIPGKASNPAVEKYQTASGYNAANDIVPWCGSFVAWCFQEAGIPYDKANAAAARSWLNFGVQVKHLSSIPIGAVMVLRRGSSTTSGHVTFFGGWTDKTKTSFRALGGNQADSVKLSTYPMSQVLDGGVRWPKKIPLPIEAEPLAKSNVIRGATTAIIAGGAAVGQSAPEIIAGLTEANRHISTGTIVGALCGVVAIIALVTIIVSRVNATKTAKAVSGVN